VSGAIDLDDDLHRRRSEVSNKAPDLTAPQFSPHSHERTSHHTAAHLMANTADKLQRDAERGGLGVAPGDLARVVAQFAKLERLLALEGASERESA
jgi:hypothetical protein